MTPEDNPADDVQPTKEEWQAFQLRSAIERYRHANDDCAGSGCTNYCCSYPGRFKEDATTIADAYLAEHPADDGGK